MMKLTFPPDNPSEAGPWRNSRLYEALPNVFPVFTYALMLWCCVAAFLVFSAGTEDWEKVDKTMRSLGAMSLGDPYGDPKWKFLTTCFIHSPVSVFHIVFNMMWLIQLGPLMERGLGTAKTVLFVVAVGFVSSAMQTAIEGSGIGLSGVVYGLCGFMWTAWPRWTGFLEKFNGQTVKLMLFWQVLCFVLTFLDYMSIGNTAHVSGMVYGAILGKWACLGNKHGKWWMAAAVGFTLFGVFCAYKPMSEWL
jgi:membrane associated rhomboid family serine protease